MTDTREDVDERTARQEELRDELREARKEVARIEREIVAESAPANAAPLIVPELDGEGGTVYAVAGETYETYEEAVEASAPEAEVEAEGRSKRSLRRGADDE